MRLRKTQSLFFSNVLRFVFFLQIRGSLFPHPSAHPWPPEHGFAHTRRRIKSFCGFAQDGEQVGLGSPDPKVSSSCQIRRLPEIPRMREKSSLPAAVASVVRDLRRRIARQVCHWGCLLCFVEATATKGLRAPEYSIVGRARRVSALGRRRRGRGRDIWQGCASNASEFTGGVQNQRRWNRLWERRFPGPTKSERARRWPRGKQFKVALASPPP